ncbi:GntR family transcriptional regulator, transcriptional repressor for pyruvate dehydrogenase complex [Litoreibacter ascidiaceicola]|uniref:GntR family transcriptional regulator, transcriptional repressor for pyruvate dehydrogenase complex n=1 Tax=Litoreibacter ascidiaceicola TaxID=1486859 RepID=A0A1M5DM16_9RHOB|nr:FadR/GntR family transcriptional regulator [Litoreibacter ascidiaceicola]SHF65523.1 transcriptional regulator, GntR family [Litoreibacter ascidiaceicola]SHF68049.1 GntR family transcriptional regulator, transcriptional repressor for pyruvate dehydrogenase complex [Litoreibacter ascidiaceicola]
MRADQKAKDAADGPGSARLFEAVERRILNEIVSEELKVGDPLPSEKELMEAFGVGRPAVREALSSLRIKGFLEVRRGERPVVSPPNTSPLQEFMSDFGRVLSLSEDGVYQLTEMRRLMESALAWEAASKATEQDISDLMRINEENASDIDAPEKFIAGDLRLHRKIFEINKNPLFEVFYKSFVAWQMPLRNDTSQNALEVTQMQHTAIVEQIAKRSPEGAYSMMNAHLYRTQSRQVEQARKRQFDKE